MIEEAQQLIRVSCTMLPMILFLNGRTREERYFLVLLYQEHKHLIYKVAYEYFHKHRASAEEAMAETVRLMCEKSDALRAVKPEKRKSYIITMTMNVCATQYQRMKKETLLWEGEAQVLEQLPAAESVTETVFSHFRAEELIRMFDALPERERALFRMRYMEDMSFAEIGKALNMRENNVRVALSRAKKHLWKIKVESEETDGEDF